MLHHQCTLDEIAGIANVSSMNELRDIALSVLERLQPPVAQVCGPITTGGRGTVVENMRFFSFAVKQLHESGIVVFDQMIFQTGMLKLRKVGSSEYSQDILDVFYRGLFSSGHIRRLYFLPDWRSSIGATWERVEATRHQIEVLDYPLHLISDFA
ncbi:MAG TPA: hypothetical protein VI981_01490 [Candidatus Paceibacterota bacterium]